MAELAQPYRHRPQENSPLNNTLTTLKIAAAETIDIAWSYNVGNNGVTAKWGDQYFLLARNLGSRVQEKLVEYVPGQPPGKGIVHDFFYEEFGIRSQVRPPAKVAVGMEPIYSVYELHANYGLPKSYDLKIPGPLAGSSLTGFNQSLYEWWQEIARREAFSYLNMDFAYYQLNDDADELERQILPKADLPKPWEFSAGDQPVHSFTSLIKVLWEEDR
tara:strand:- start:22 stop:672 length:651 start_codon:yes stop_codon:yes gene_type:complete